MSDSTNPTPAALAALPLDELEELRADFHEWLKDHDGRPSTTLSMRQMVMLMRVNDAFAALLAALEAGRRDSKRLDWLEAMLNVGSDPVEVFFAGLRSDINLMRPDAIQVEVEAASKTYHRVYSAADLRAAVDAAAHHPKLETTHAD